VTPYKPLVIGAPRSGFALLASVVIHFIPLAPSKLDLRQRLLNALMREAGQAISDSIVATFAADGITNDLLYNPNFRYVVGGPKWLREDRPGYAAFRKYIGVRGKGDFTLVTSHPRQLLDMDEIVHSHVTPSWWPEHPGYQDYTRYASVRNPLGILNSSIFSLNALASEYIQKFIPPEFDNDDIRQNLALYKYTDLRFFEGLFSFLADYLEEFMKARDEYIVMHWEDLILSPEDTISQLASRSEIDLPPGFAKSIWKKLDHVNLTQAHKHNYRAGKGIVGDWRNWITNRHLALLKEHGFDHYSRELGYGEIEFLDESTYTPFQNKVDSYLKRGEIHDDFADKDLFEYAFNKSNFKSNAFPFQRYDWRDNTQIERSTFSDTVLEQKIWDVAENATASLNSFVEDFLSRDWSNVVPARHQLEALQQKHLVSSDSSGHNRYQAGFNAAFQLLDSIAVQAK
jgi:hypothetical protein